MCRFIPSGSTTITTWATTTGPCYDSVATDYHALRPDIWRASHGESIRTYRTRERRDRADHKQRRRAQRRIANAESR